MLQGDYLSVLEARSRDEFHGAVVRFAQHWVSRPWRPWRSVDKGIGEAEFITVDNTPTAYLQVFAGAGSGRAIR